MNAPYSSAPATVTPHIHLSNFNVSIGGKMIYQESRTYDWMQFLTENRHANNINGGITTSLSCGLISEDDFNNGYGFIYVDLSRHSLASDGQQHQIMISGTNNNLVAIDLYVFLGYEKSIKMSIANGQVIEQ